MWLYKYNYLDFNKKVPLQSQRGAGYYRSSCSLDAYVGQQLPTIYNHRGYISQSFESYLNKSGYTVQNNSRSNQNGFLRQNCPNIYNASKLTNTSDEGYHSNLDSTDLHSSNVKNETSQNTPFDFSDNRLSSTDTGGCLFTTFKPHEDSTNHQTSNNHSSEPNQDNNHGYINKNRISTNNSPGRLLTTLKETEIQNHNEVEPVNKGNTPDHLTHQENAKTARTDVVAPIKTESDARIEDIPKIKDSDKSKKKTGWKVNFKLCWECGFKKKFLLACLQ